MSTIAHRTFDTYDAYVYHQGGKARGRREHLLSNMAGNTESFTRVFRKVKPHLTSGPVLCLGARTGAESIGAERAGFVGSVGIDLHPVGPTVLQGDWHALTFGDASFANAYCNSLDHCLYLDRFAAEVRRVLVPDGRLYVMATNRPQTEAEWREKFSKSNEALFWQTSDDLRDAIVGLGFAEVTSWRDGKWGHYILKVAR